jgi:Heparinase II/III-like protein
MLSRYNAADIETALRAAPPFSPFPSISDRKAWDGYRSTAAEQHVATIIANAEQDAKTPIPDLPATLWLEFVRNGQREGFQAPRSKRRQMLADLTLAECFENKGRFLDPLLNIIWAICEESSWSLPAHQIRLTDMERHHIDLGVAGTAWELAEADALIGPLLDPLAGKRIRYELNQRCFIPYLTRHDHWWLYNTEQRTVNNWTAVCNAGVVGAALYVEQDISRLAEMIARAARSLDDYLSTFDADGGSTEGAGYWTYGFGNFTVIAHLVEQRTGGRVRFMDEEIVRKAAQFPLRTALSTGVHVNFSDCDANVTFLPCHLAYLSRRLDLPDLMRLARMQPGNKREGELGWALRALAWWPSAEPAGAFTSAKHDWFSQMQWMVARLDPKDADALALAAKGGHNGEMHNQNDVGNIIVHLNGESVIPDVGRGRYTRAYFGPERYTHFVNSSRGHSVPVVNGFEQAVGKQHAAQAIAHSADATADCLVIEMKDAYPAGADLASLRRSVTLHRDTPRGWVELVDSIRFASKPGTCDSVLTTFAAVEVGASAVTLRGKKGALTVTFDPAVVTASVTTEKNVDLALGAADVHLVTFSLKKTMKRATIRLRIEPA